MKILFAARRLRQNWVIGCGIGLAAFILAFVIRWSINVTGLPFITFFPAVLAAGIFGGVAAGVIVAALGLLAARFYFVGPAFFMGLSATESAVPLVLFALAAAVELLLIGLLNRAIDQLWSERERSNTLFRELQHRVANNLHFIAALLHLQRRLPQSKDEALAAAEIRIETMGRIHRRLYDPANADRPISQHLRELCRDLIESAGANHVALQVQDAELRLPIDKIVPVSLIVAEAVTNCLKHAFGATAAGRIEIAADVSTDRECRLTIADNGCGDAGGARETAAGLGRRIIDSLAQQIGGTVQVASGHQGTTVTLVFPLVEWI